MRRGVVHFQVQPFTLTKVNPITLAVLPIQAHQFLQVLGYFHSLELRLPAPERFEDTPDGPNLYDLTLMLNLDPGLHAWWEAVVRIFTAYYGADRLSLALPADAGEVENVPWGQKATYSQSGQPAVNPKTFKKENIEAPKLGLKGSATGTLLGSGSARTTSRVSSFLLRLRLPTRTLAASRAR